MESGYGPGALSGISRWFDCRKLPAPVSGSAIHHGMVVLPYSMHSRAAVAFGFPLNLIHRVTGATGWRDILVFSAGASSPGGGF